MEHEKKASNYQPLIVILSVIALASVALQADRPNFGLYQLMNHFMGLFFVVFAMLKLFDINGFANGFQMYDILAKKTRLYAYLYPFIELSLGLLYLSNFCPYYTNAVTLAVMALSAAGVIKSIRSGMNIKCACLGTVLSVPLSTVSVIENVGMGLMAALMLAHIS